MKKKTKWLWTGLSCLTAAAVIIPTAAVLSTHKSDNNLDLKTSSLTTNVNNKNNVTSFNNVPLANKPSQKQTSSQVPNGLVNDSKLISVNHNAEIVPINNLANNNAGDFNLTFASGEFEYRQTSSNGVSVTGFARDKYQTNLSIPNFVVYNSHFYKVNGIGPGAFANQQISSVNFPSGLETIGNFAFSNNNLTSLKLPSNLIDIGQNAFDGNPFAYNYAVALGPHTQWNKTWLNSSFGTHNNYGLFVSGIQTVIQDNAVYQFDPVQKQWMIVSYIPTENAGALTYTISPNRSYFTKDHAFNENFKQAPYNHLAQTSVSLALSTSSLANQIIYFNDDWGNYSGSIYFNPSNKKITVNPKFNGAGIFNDDAGRALEFSLYNPNSNKYLYNGSVSGYLGNSSLYSDLNNRDFSYGDIVGLRMVNPTSHNQINIASNYENGSSYEDWNNYVNINVNSLNHHNLMTSYFVITPHGLIPTQLNLGLTSLSYDAKSKTVELIANTLPNKKVSIYIDYLNKTFTTTSNDLGQVDLKIPFNLPSNLNRFNPQATITVEGMGATTTNIAGDNPLESLMDFTLRYGSSRSSTLNFKLGFDGWTGKLCLTSSNQYYPIMETQHNMGSSTINDVTTNAVTDPNWTDTITFTNTTTNQTQTIQVHGNEKVQDILNQISNLNFTCGDSYSFSSYRMWINQIHTNGGLIPFGIQRTYPPGKPELMTFKFKLTKAGIINEIPVDASENNGWYTGQMGHNYATTSIVGGNSYVAIGWDAMYEDDYAAKNWLNITQEMKDVVAQITSGFSSSLQKVLAIERWVSANMKYTDRYSYGKTIDGTFKHLEGVCGNFADLASVMCYIAGFVSRVVIGDALGNVNFDSSYSIIDHAWTQVWIPELGEWITLDPTWGWFGSPSVGQLYSAFTFDRSNMHICSVLWPKGTNYFSYFKGYEYQALNNLGRYFNIQKGRQEANTYLPATAAGLTALFNKASVSDEYWNLHININAI